MLIQYGVQFLQILYLQIVLLYVIYEHGHSLTCRNNRSVRYGFYQRVVYAVVSTGTHSPTSHVRIPQLNYTPPYNQVKQHFISSFGLPEMLLQREMAISYANIRKILSSVLFNCLHMYHHSKTGPQG